MQILPSGLYTNELIILLSHVLPDLGYEAIKIIFFDLSITFFLMN